MSSKRDPVLVVMEYFQTADLALARQALTMAQAVIKSRTGGSKPKAVPAATTRRQLATPGPVSTVGNPGA